MLSDTNRANNILLPLLGEHSLILLGGECHQRQRRLLMPPFHGDCLRTYGQLICTITGQVINQWKVGEVFTVRASTQETSLQVILSTVFGLHEEQRFDQLSIPAYSSRSCCSSW